MPNWTNLQWRAARGSNNDPVLGPTDLGGDVAEFIAAATLNVGDVVFLSADNTVNKSNTAANFTKFIGVVVGGDSLGGYIAQDSDLKGTAALQAATVGKTVLVQINGIARVISDAAVASGIPVTTGTTTAGRVIGGATAIAGQIIGTSLTTAAGPAINIRMLIAPR